MSPRPVVEVALFSDRIEDVKRFYQTLLGSSPETDWPGGAIYDSGQVKILLHVGSGQPDDGPANQDHFALGVAELDRTCEELEAEGIELEVEPREYPWGRSAYLRDPDGRLVELAELPCP